MVPPSLLAFNLAPIRWSSTANPTIKLNFDGAVFQESGEASLRVVAQDSMGLFLASLVE